MTCPDPSLLAMRAAGGGGEVDAHLASCQACRDIVAADTRVAASVAAAAPAPSRARAERLVRAALAALDAEDRRTVRFARAYAAAAAMIAITIGGWLASTGAPEMVADPDEAEQVALAYLFHDSGDR